jgi:acyl-CoA synthetase (AMP-forming)/AMP-acid ligase II
MSRTRYEWTVADFAVWWAGAVVVPIYETSSAEQVEWSDGSLGCPQKGMDYTQALVDGELLMLRVEQALFQYHSARGGPFTYCAAPDASYTVTG